MVPRGRGHGPAYDKTPGLPPRGEKACLRRSSQTFDLGLALQDLYHCPRHGLRISKIYAILSITRCVDLRSLNAGHALGINERELNSA